MGRRLALLIATYDYHDAGLRRLTAPARDAESLAAVLGDPGIAGFEVTTLVNEPHHRVGEAIGEFYQDRRRDDLTLLYFTGHGLKDDSGRLYLAMTNTRRGSLLFTAISAEQIDQAMTGCMSRQKVLILDCCYSGAYPAGHLAKADPDVHALDRFQGHGCTILTASDAAQYSFEGDALAGQAPQSVFTRHLVNGLRDGGGDLDGDGDITLDELYSYVHDRVTEEMPQQRPKRKDNVEGRIVIARNVNWILPAYLTNAIASPIATDRLAALDGLEHLYRIGNTMVRDRVLEQIRHLADDDSKVVSAKAAGTLHATAPSPPQPATAQRPETALRADEPTTPAEVSTGPPTAASAPAAVQQPPATPATDVTPQDPVGPQAAAPGDREDAILAAGGSAPVDVPAHQQSSGGRRRRGLVLLAAVAAIFLAAVITIPVIVLNPGHHQSSGGSAASSGGPLVRGLAISPDGHQVYVATSSGYRVIDTATRSVTAGPVSIPIGVLGMAVSHDGRHLYLTSAYNDAITVVNTQTNAVENPIIVGNSGHLTGIAASPDGRHLYVTGSDPDRVVAIDTTTAPMRQVTSPPMAPTFNGAPLGIAVNPVGEWVYVAWFESNAVQADDPVSLSSAVLYFVNVHQPSNLAVSPDGRRLYVSSINSRTISVFVRGRATGRLTLGQDVENGGGMAVSPDGTRLYVASATGTSVSVFDTKGGKPVGDPITIS